MISLVLMFLVSAGSFLSLQIQPDVNDLQITQDGNYQRITSDEFLFLGDEGEPDLPYMPVRIALQNNWRVTDVTLDNCQYETLTGTFRIAPVTPVECFREMGTALSEPDVEIYERNSLYPENSIVSWHSGVLWGLPVASAWLRPVQWNPVTSELRVLRSACINVHYEVESSLPLISQRAIRSENLAREIMLSTVLNPEDVGFSGAALVGPEQLEYGQYVIVTVPEYLDPMQRLAEWKTAKGIPASVYTTEWIQSNYPFKDLQQSVRGFLTDCRDQGVDFVLLVGDNDVFQARFALFSDVWGSLPSDLYYADINDVNPGDDLWDRNENGIWGEYQDNIDWHPDLWVGRASVNTLDEAETFLDKVLIYEGIQTIPELSRSEEMVFGYTTGFLQPNSNPGSYFAELISDFVPDQWTETKLYESQGNNSTELTLEMLNSGVNQVLHCNHGSPDEMFTAYGDILTAVDILGLQNISSTGTVSIWNSIACELGAFDTLTSCADAWLNSPGGGGFACMNARSVMASVSFPICEYFYKSFLVDSFFNLGIAHGLSLDYLCPPAGNNSGGTLQGNNLFGDPELPIRTADYGELSVSHPSVFEGSGMVTVQVLSSQGFPVEDARVCIQKGNWKTGEIYQINYTGASGTASISVDPLTTGDITLTATAHNFDPYQVVIPVTSVEYCESDYLSMRVTGNPGTTSAELLISLPAPSDILLNIYSLTGRVVATPASGQFAQGVFSTTVEDLLPGVYFARLNSGNESVTVNFTLTGN